MSYSPLSECWAKCFFIAEDYSVCVFLSNYTNLTITEMLFPYTG